MLPQPDCLSSRMVAESVPLIRNPDAASAS